MKQKVNVILFFIFSDKYVKRLNAEGETVKSIPLCALPLPTAHCPLPTPNVLNGPGPLPLFLNSP